MIEVCRTIRTSPEQIFAVLADGWSYARWVVGAAHIRAVDEGWPAVNTRVHHRVGPWPMQLNDRTVAWEMTPNRLLELDAYAPLGQLCELRRASQGCRCSVDVWPVAGTVSWVMRRRRKCRSVSVVARSSAFR
jgi:hypothetical protein